jgi:hypothetical protein
MMTAIKTENITFYTAFVNGGAGATGLAPTVNVHGPTGIVVNGAAATEVDAVNSPGLYSYTLTYGLMPSSGMYVAFFEVGAGADVLAKSEMVYIAPWAWEVNQDVNSLIRMLQNNTEVRRYMREEKIEIKRSTDVDFDVWGLGDLTGRTALYFTVKKMNEKDEATDAQSIIQIEETAGLLFINKNSAGTPANGVLTVVDELAGQINVTLAADESTKIEPNTSYCYDIKMDNTVVGEGKFYVSTAITRTIT